MSEEIRKQQLKNYWLEDHKDQKSIDKKEAIGQLQLEVWLSYAQVGKLLFDSLTKFESGDYSEYQKLKAKIKNGEFKTIDDQSLLKIVEQLEKEEEKIQQLLEIAEKKPNKNDKDTLITKLCNMINPQIGFIHSENYYMIKSPISIIIHMYREFWEDSVYEKLFGRKTNSIGFHGKRTFGLEIGSIDTIITRSKERKADTGTLNHETEHTFFGIFSKALKPKKEILGINNNQPETVIFPERVRENYIADVKEYREKLKEPNSPLMKWSLEQAKNELLARMVDSDIFLDQRVYQGTDLTKGLMGNAEAYDFATDWILHQASQKENYGFGNVSLLMLSLVPEYLKLLKEILAKTNELIKLYQDVPGHLELLPWILMQIPINQWVEKIDEVLIPEIKYKKAMLQKGETFKEMVTENPQTSGYRYYRVGSLDQ